jgi:hypothetical protein
VVDHGLKRGLHPALGPPPSLGLHRIRSSLVAQMEPIRRKAKKMSTVVHAGVCGGQPRRMVPLAPPSAGRGVCTNTYTPLTPSFSSRKIRASSLFVLIFVHFDSRVGVWPRDIPYQAAGGVQGFHGRGPEQCWKMLDGSYCPSNSDAQADA